MRKGFACNSVNLCYNTSIRFKWAGIPTFIYVRGDEKKYG